MKHYHKRKKVVLDVIDNTIINDHKALKLSNIELYIEKNGYKLVKILIAVLFIPLLSYSVHADSIFKIDITTTSNLTILGFCVAIFLFMLLFSIYKNIVIMYWISCIGFLIIGFILLISGFQPIISGIILIMSLIFMANEGG